MKNEPLISIIVPVFMTESYIERCIDSVLNQSFTNFELILIDDGTKDLSGVICDRFAKQDGRIVVVHKENGGQGSARNIGIDISRGEYITFLDSDDTIEYNFLEIMYNNINDYQLILCGINRVYSNNIVQMGDNKAKTLDGQLLFENVLNVQKGYGFVWGKLWKKSALKNTRFDKRLKIAEDALFILEASEYILKVKIIDDRLYNYYFNEESTVRKFNNHYAENCLKSMEVASDSVRSSQYFQKILNVNQKLAEYVSYHILLIVVNYCSHPQNGENFLGKLTMLKEILKYPIFKESIKLSGLRSFSMSRKIPLIFLKYKLNFLAIIIGYIRQVQFRNQ